VKRERGPCVSVVVASAAGPSLVTAIGSVVAGATARLVDAAGRRPLLRRARTRTRAAGARTPLIASAPTPLSLGAVPRTPRLSISPLGSHDGTAGSDSRTVGYASESEETVAQSYT
jgi:hypothetical protein